MATASTTGVEPAVEDPGRNAEELDALSTVDSR
jgi:hypothetical protein